jgi:dCTP deaminase
MHLLTKGVLPIQKLKDLVRLGIIYSEPAYPIKDDQFQPNSIDLRLGETAYRVRCSFLPENDAVASKLEKLTQHSFSIKEGAVLEPNCTYIIPLLEKVDFSKVHLRAGTSKFLDNELYCSELLSAKANPKSSTGRLDIFTRVITDFNHRFEEIEPGYVGGLYLEVVPKSFSIKVRTGQRLNQLRVHHGHSTVSDEDILRLHEYGDPFLLKEDGNPVAVSALKVNQGLFMSVSLRPGKNGIIGYKAKKNRSLIDFDKIGVYRVNDFWDPIFFEQDDYLILEPEAFYIFASKERIRVPRHLAAEMVPYDTGSGELRTHYAGFFDSGFGGNTGAHAVLEVRSHDVPFLIEDGQTFFRMTFENNMEIPSRLYGDTGSNHYQGQGLKLSKHFVDP